MIPNALTSKQMFSDMFAKYKSKWSKLSKATHGVRSGKVYDILTLTEQKKALVMTEMPHWSPPAVRLGAAAVHLYNRRLLDLSERDHVQLLWMAVGTDLMRVHEGGQLFVYQPEMGYWKAFEGLPPPNLFEVIRQFFVLLEGLFRNLKGHVNRDDKSLLKAIDAVVQGKSFDELLVLCESACAWNKGNHLLKKASAKTSAAKGAVAIADGAAPDEVPDVDTDFMEALSLRSSTVLHKVQLLLVRATHLHARVGMLTLTEGKLPPLHQQIRRSQAERSTKASLHSPGTLWWPSRSAASARASPRSSRCSASFLLYLSGVRHLGTHALGAHTRIALSSTTSAASPPRTVSTKRMKKVS